jgi:PBP1b-binding outer membrane lipoprotein LpoB
LKKYLKFLTVFILIIVIFSGCSKKDKVDTVSDTAEDTTAETVYLEKMEKFTYGYEPVEKDTAVIAGVFVTNTSEIKIEFLNLSDGEQIVATLYSKDNEVGTDTATSENTDLKFANLSSETEYTLELKNTGSEAVGIECLISQ